MSAESTESEIENEEALAYGRWLFAQACQFLLGVARLDQLPDTELPEAAFVGRSNVGKSSLINALTGQNNLARTSNSPGRTQELNFFVLGDRMMLADLPGYGFAKAPKQKVAAWTTQIKAYLRGRATLRRALLLIDSRHGIKNVDREVMKLMDEAAVSYQAVLTKCDKISATELAKQQQATAKELATHVAAHPVIISTSARKGGGIPELRAALATLAAPRDFM